MNRLVRTTKGLLHESELEVKEIRTDGENDVSITRQWFHNGELVRQDGWVTLLRGVEATTEGGL